MKKHRIEIRFDDEIKCLLDKYNNKNQIICEIIKNSQEMNVFKRSKEYKILKENKLIEKFNNTSLEEKLNITDNIRETVTKQNNNKINNKNINDSNENILQETKINHIKLDDKYKFATNRANPTPEHLTYIYNVFKGNNQQRWQELENKMLNNPLLNKDFNNKNNEKIMEFCLYRMIEEYEEYYTYITDIESQKAEIVGEEAKHLQSVLYYYHLYEDHKNKNTK